MELRRNSFRVCARSRHNQRASVTWGVNWASTKAFHMRKTKLDPQAIRRLIDAGLSDEEIARKMHWTVGTLRVVCSLQKISLRRSVRLVRRRLTSTITLPRDIFTKLRGYAAMMGTSAADLAEKLLRVIVRDNLYKAVLDVEPAEDHRVARHSHARIESHTEKHEKPSSQSSAA
jgi:hypothetical protein